MIIVASDHTQTDTHTHAHAHTYTKQDSTGRVIGVSQRPLLDYKQHSQETNIHAPGCIRTRNPSNRADVYTRLRRAATGFSPLSFYKEKYRDLNRQHIFMAESEVSAHLILRPFVGKSHGSLPLTSHDQLLFPRSSLCRDRHVFELL